MVFLMNFAKAALTFAHVLKPHPSRVWLAAGLRGRATMLRGLVLAAAAAIPSTAAATVGGLRAAAEQHTFEAICGLQCAIALEKPLWPKGRLGAKCTALSIKTCRAETHLAAPLPRPGNRLCTGRLWLRLLLLHLLRLLCLLLLLLLLLLLQLLLQLWPL